ncbi:MAG: hypothetical protein EOO71_06430 [Myxococcaceae bacterium]|nr:MAG: hypothetical protein EOO71_06430 [Myxococcaceae bacterium]
MADASWGNCKSCRFFAGNSDEPSDNDVQSCNQPALKEFALLVSADSGCNAYEAQVGETVPIGEESSPAMH